MLDDYRIDILNFILGIVLPRWLFCIHEQCLVSEKKARYRAGTHDYYDNPIKNFS